LSPRVTHQTEIESTDFIETLTYRELLKVKFFLVGIVGGGVQLGPLGTAGTNSLIVPAAGDYDDADIGGMIGRGNEVLGENLSQCRFVHHKTHMLPGH
jgi:hypothetical protein